MRRLRAALAIGILAGAATAFAQTNPPEPSAPAAKSDPAPGAATTAAGSKSFVLDGSARRSFHGLTSTGPRRFESDEEAQTIVDRIARFLPVWNQVRAYVTDDPNTVANAEANMDASGNPIIGFNRVYMRDLKAQAGNYWALVGIAAHEVGHHTGNHITMSQDNCKLNNDIELQADFYAGFALAKMGVKRDDAISTMRSMPQSATCSHPPREQRVVVIDRGWTQGGSAQVAGLSGTAPLGPSGGAAATRGAVPATPPAQPDPSGQPAATPTTATTEAAKTASAAAQAIAKAPKTALENFKIRRNRDVYGHDLEKLPGVTENGCAERCLRHGRCKGFSYDRWNGWCFLKDDMPASLLDPSSFIAVRTSASFPAVASTADEMHRLRRKKFTDRAFATTRNGNYDACYTQCANTRECVAFTYDKTSGDCQMHQNTVGHFYDENFDAGFKRQLPEGAEAKVVTAAATPTVRIEIEKGKYFKGDGIDKHEDASAKDCEALCLKDRRCQALEYKESERVCRLYSKIEPAVATTGTNVGYKRSN